MPLSALSHTVFTRVRLYPRGMSISPCFVRRCNRRRTSQLLSTYRHKESFHERAAEWVASFEGAIGWESQDVVFADGDVAFSHWLSHVTGTLKTGAEVDMWFRTTLGLQHRSGHWLIVHEHSSSPFDPKIVD